MKALLSSFILAAGLLSGPIASAQTQQPVTATCKDGTSFNGTTRSGACRGHQGVATWTTAAVGTSTTGTPTTGMAPMANTAPGIAPAAPPPARTAIATPTTPPAGIPARESAGAMGTTNTAAAKMGGPGQVWVNSATKVYHCPGDRYYGKTKAGEFMSVTAAQAAGDRPAAGKACSS